MPAAGATQVHHPPGFCPYCRRIFPVTAIAIGGGGTIRVQSSRTNCPSCGRSAEILDGTYSALGERLNAFLAPSISDAARAAVVELFKQVQAGEKSIDEAKQEASALHPRLGKLFDIVHWPPQAQATLYAAVIGAFALLVAPRLSPSPTTDVHIEVALPPEGSRAVPSPSHQRRQELKKQLLSGTALITPKPKR
jgi:hypothetical protein